MLTLEKWTMEDFSPEIRSTILGITSKETQTSAVQKALAEELIDRDYPHREWTHAYTDGSAVNATQNGGSGVYIRPPDGQTTSLSLPVGQLSTNFTAEVKAITAAAIT